MTQQTVTRHQCSTCPLICRSAQPNWSWADPCIVTRIVHVITKGKLVCRTSCLLLPAGGLCVSTLLLQKLWSCFWLLFVCFKVGYTWHIKHFICEVRLGSKGWKFPHHVFFKFLTLHTGHSLITTANSLCCPWSYVMLFLCYTQKCLSGDLTVSDKLPFPHLFIFGFRPGSNFLKLTTKYLHHWSYCEVCGSGKAGRDLRGY